MSDLGILRRNKKSGAVILFDSEFSGTMMVSDGIFKVGTYKEDWVSCYDDGVFDDAENYAFLKNNFYKPAFNIGDEVVLIGLDWKLTIVSYNSVTGKYLMNNGEEYKQQAFDYYVNRFFHKKYISDVDFSGDGIRHGDGIGAGYGSGYGSGNGYGFGSGEGYG